MRIINVLLRLLLGITSLALLFIVLNWMFRVLNGYIQNPLMTAILLAATLAGLLTAYIIGSAIEQMVFGEEA